MIRKLRTDELKKVFHLGDKFTAESKFTLYDKDFFINSWSLFINSGFGVIFVEDDYGHFPGFIGGLCFQDPNSGIPTTSEMFWYVDPNYRDKGIGDRLLVTFERWAKENQSQRIIMIHLASVMPEKVKQIYLKRGYSKLETHYIKEI